MESKAQLQYPGKGMSLDTIKAHEYQEGGHWFRIEIEQTKNGLLQAFAYMRIGAYWKHHWSQRTAMEKRVMLKSMVGKEAE